MSLVKKSFAQGEVIIKQGDYDTRFYLLVAGRTEVVIDGHKVREINAGESFGVISFLLHQPRAATIIAKEKCDTVEFNPKNKQTFYELILQHESLLRSVVEGLTLSLKGTNEHFLNKLEKIREDLEACLRLTIQENPEVEQIRNKVNELLSFVKSESK